MGFDWREFLNIAKFLKEEYHSLKLNQQAVFRSAISRAYYAAYHHACDYAEKKLNFTPTKSGIDHQEIRKHLRNKNRNSEATKLSQIHQWRTFSDYHKNMIISDIEVASCIKKTEEIINIFTK